MQELEQRLDEIARTPVLLVAADFDGTLAPIADAPELAEAKRESVVALKSLAAMGQTHVAVISGRSLENLSKLLADAHHALLVGSHGSEFDKGFAATLPADAVERFSRLRDAVTTIAGRVPCARVEHKPASVAFHFRKCDENLAKEAVDELVQGAGRWPGVHVRHGKKVIELGVVSTDKGKALQRLRQRLGATAVIFLGDDLTDEDAFATLAGPDIGVKVGEGSTVAKFRVSDAMDVTNVLARLTEARSKWLAGSEAVPIEQHSMLSDQRTCALVTPEGRISWFCAPRIDSVALFAELLGGATAGFFEIRPVDPAATAKQEYVGSSFVLKTDWGGFQVYDYLDTTAGRAFQRAGRTDLVRVIEGHGRAKITFSPRMNFSTLQTHLRVRDEGLEIDGAIDPCVLISHGLRWQIHEEGRHHVATAEVDVGGGPIVLELRYGTGNMSPSAGSESRRREQTQKFWDAWAVTLQLPEVKKDLVLRSALTLRALSYGPTGSFAAAATTSLPETAGGIRNWDYRFCWPRDASMSATALIQLGSTGAAMKLLDFIVSILDNAPPDSLIRPVYTVTGGHLGPESEIPELGGYLGSRPVRIGNLAAHQVQLDVFGPIAEMMAQLADHGAPLTGDHFNMLRSMVHAVQNRWKEADHGIWEIRDNRKHHVHSKVMCWQTIDRAIRVGRFLGSEKQEWIALRQEIRDDILANGFNEHKNAFCSTYESDEADAAALYVGLSGLLPPDDPRFVGTVAYVEKELLEGPTVYRYLFEDGLPGKEGGFNICTSWLIESYCLLGRWADAERLFEQYCNLAGATGLMAEEYDPRAKIALGNFPQAYTHLGLINCALRLANRNAVPSGNLTTENTKSTERQPA